MSLSMHKLLSSTKVQTAVLRAQQDTVMDNYLICSHSTISCLCIRVVVDRPAVFLDRSHACGDTTLSRCCVSRGCCTASTVHLATRSLYQHNVLDQAHCYFMVAVAFSEDSR